MGELEQVQIGIPNARRLLASFRDASLREPNARDHYLGAYLGPITLAEHEREQREAEERERKAQDERDAEQRSRRWSVLEKLRIPLTESDESALVREKLRADIGKSFPAVRDWCDDQNAAKILVLCGPPGRGKTLAAAWAALRVSPASYYSARKWEQLRMASFGDEAQAYESALARQGLLIIDDLGREESAERMTSAILDVADHRRGTGKRAILIANMTRKALQERYVDARLWSRLEESAQFVADAGEDLRKAVKP